MKKSYGTLITEDEKPYEPKQDVYQPFLPAENEWSFKGNTERLKNMAYEHPKTAVMTVTFIAILIGLTIFVCVILLHAHQANLRAWHRVVTNSHKYFVKLNPQVWAARADTFPLFLTYLQTVAANANLQYNSSKPLNQLKVQWDFSTPAQSLRIWNQQMLDTPGMSLQGSHATLQVRNYVLAVGNGTQGLQQTSAVYLSFLDGDDQIAAAMPMDPTTAQQTGGTQEMRHEFYWSQTLGSLVTMCRYVSGVVQVPYQVNFTSVSDGSALFQNFTFFIDPNPPSTTPLVVTSSNYVWSLSYDWNILGTNQILQSILYLTYNSFDDAISGTAAPQNPYWTFRVFSPSNGTNVAYNPTTVMMCHVLFETVVNGPWSVKS